MPRSISASIDQVARSALGKDWGLYAGLLEHWAEIVGPDYAKETTPVKITFPHGKKTDEKWASRRAGGTLTISLPQGLTMAVTHQTDTILSRINGFFGYNAIGKIALKPYYPTQTRAFTPIPRSLTGTEKDQLKNLTNIIENNELKEALETLGASVLANRAKV